MEQSTNFGFGGGGQDIAHNVADDVEGTIEWRFGVGLGMVAQIVV